MNCVLCGTDGAYVGLQEVKCLNKLCRAYNHAYLMEEWGFIFKKPVLDEYDVLPEIEFELTVTQVEAKPRKLKFK